MGLIPLIMGITSMAMQASQDEPKPPPAPEPPAAIGNEGAIRAAKESEMRRRKQGRGGRASTIMSGSPLGVPGQANTSRKLLTGY